MKNRVLTVAGIVVAITLIFAIGISAQTDSKETKNATLISSPNAVYPDDARAAGFGGTVRVRVSVDEVGNAKVVDAFGPDSVCKSVTDPRIIALRDSAMAAARQATFSPAIRKGKPVESGLFLNYNFGKMPADWMFSGKSSAGGETAYAATATEAEGTSRVINGGVINGKAMSLPKPPYPPAARAVRASGAVNVQVLIDLDGNVFAAESVSGHPLLRAASESAACGARFTPTMLEGKSVKVTGIITYNFVP